MRLAANAGHKKSSKICHLGTIAQLCRAISSQIRHVSTIRNKLVKQQCVLQMSPQYGVLQPASGWDRFTSLGHPCKFQRVSRLGSVTERQSSSERQPNFVALNRGRYLCSAGRPSRWALAHILVFDIYLEDSGESVKLLQVFCGSLLVSLTHLLGQCRTLFWNCMMRSDNTVLRTLSHFIRNSAMAIGSITACMVKAVVKANSQSNGNGQISPPPSWIFKFSNF